MEAAPLVLALATGLAGVYGMLAKSRASALGLVAAALLTACCCDPAASSALSLVLAWGPGFVAEGLADLRHF